MWASGLSNLGADIQSRKPGLKGLGVATQPFLLARSRLGNDPWSGSKLIWMRGRVSSDNGREMRWARHADRSRIDHPDPADWLRWMMARSIIALALACIVAVGWSGTAAVAKDGAQSLPSGLTLAKANNAGFAKLPNLLNRGGDLLERAQYSCYRGCKRCRRRCIVDWKWDCGGYGCRRGFSRCMKHCWEDICRYCN